MLMLLTLGFLSPIIELYLKGFGLSETIAGLVYSIYTFVYFVTSIMENYISQFMSQKKLISLGVVLTSISFLLISYSHVPNSVFIASLGLGLMGFSSAIMYSKVYLVPTPAHLLFIASNHYGIPRNDSLVDGVSSLTNFFSNLGEIFGPLLGGFLSEWLGFSYAFLFMAFFCLCYFVIYAIVSDLCISDKYVNGNQHIEMVDISLDDEPNKTNKNHFTENN